MDWHWGGTKDYPRHIPTEDHLRATGERLLERLFEDASSRCQGGGLQAISENGHFSLQFVGVDREEALFVPIEESRQSA